MQPSCPIIIVVSVIYSDQCTYYTYCLSCIIITQIGSYSTTYAICVMCALISIQHVTKTTITTGRPRHAVALRYQLYVAVV